MRVTGQYEIKKNGALVAEGDNLVTDEGIKRIALGTYSPSRLNYGLSKISPSKASTELGGYLGHWATSSSTTVLDDGSRQITYIVNVPTRAEELTFNEIGLSAGDGILLTHANTADLYGRLALITVLPDEEIQITYKVTISIGQSTPVTLRIGNQLHQATLSPHGSSLAISNAIFYEGNTSRRTSNVVKTYDNATKRVTFTMAEILPLEMNGYEINKIRLGYLDFHLNTPFSKTKYQKMTVNLAVQWQ